MVLFINWKDFHNEHDVIIQQVPLEKNRTRAWIINTGIFDADLRTAGASGFEWPKDSGKFAVFSAGLSIAAQINNQLRMAMASWKGEFAPGYVIDSAGVPKAKTNSRFKLYSVRKTDNYVSNPDWLNWGYMVPYGAPYVDVNNNGSYEYLVDTPGIRNAAQTIFCCLTDGFPEEHKIGEGFGGGTLPLFAESHLTAWAYDFTGLQDVQFLKWKVINKNTSLWEKTYFSIICDGELGNSNDDYTGCDTNRQVGYIYNCDSLDEENYGGYGLNPPAFGIDLLLGAVNKNINPVVNIKMSSSISFNGTNVGGPQCESDPNGQPQGAYWFMKGYKKDGTPWVIPNTNPPKVTKFCYSGDPETFSGWTEKSGGVWNCNGSLYGNLVVPNSCRDRRFMLNTGAENFIVNPGDTQIIMIAQFIARGTNNLNSVTKLKQLSDFVQSFVDNGFVIGVNPISTHIPGGFKLYQNYPNPFNPVTTIKFDTPPQPSPKERGQNVKLIIYDVIGKEVEVLVDEVLNSGTYSVEWDASACSSGVYYYKLVSGDYTETKKMVLIK